MLMRHVIKYLNSYVIDYIKRCIYIILKCIEYLIFKYNVKNILFKYNLYKYSIKNIYRIFLHKIVCRFQLVLRYFMNKQLKKVP